MPSLWAAPRLTRATGLDATQAAQELVSIHLAMLVAFVAWGAVTPQLARRGITPLQLMRWGLPLCLLLLGLNVALGADAGAAHWAAWRVACTFVPMSQPAGGAAFPTAQAGRALSACNLVISGGVFGLQWGMGLGIDALRAQGFSDATAFRAVFAVFGAACVAADTWFLRGGGQAPHNAP